MSLPLRCRWFACCAILTGLVLAADVSQAEQSDTSTKSLATGLEKLSPEVLSDQQRDEASSMIDRDLRRRRDAANAQNRAEWNAIQNREQWEAYRDERIKRLRESLAQFPDPPQKLNVKTTGVIDGDGFRIENVVYETRPGDWVTGNLYVPNPPRKSMPGILIAHAHHAPKKQGEMQDMGMTWARAGCQVLVIDQVGYGERRAHPFNGPQDYGKDYSYSRQDYYYRYDSGIQLQLTGESLMGWFAWDLMRGVDLLLARPGTDPQRIIILGAVAGGGDPCGVTAALDPRIAAAVPFNFGGPQPETQYPLPDDAETSFNYLMGSYWDSTRGLRRTAADGFFHWVITSSIAPRRLIHGHEFSWDGERDPVWKRYQEIYGDFYGMPDNLAVAHGYGTLKGTNPRGSHCTNIGQAHRSMIHPAFAKWFDIHVAADDEYSARRESHELDCMTAAAREELQPQSFTAEISRIGHQRATAARAKLQKLPPARQQAELRTQWQALLGDIELKAQPKVLSTKTEQEPAGFVTERVVLEVEPDVVVPLLLIHSAESQKSKHPITVALAQGGKAGFLEHRSAEIAALLAQGQTVCLPDLRGTGETRSGTSRGRSSGDGNRSVNLLMFDQTMVGQRLRDLKSVLAYLKQRDDVAAKQITLWGDSFVPTNSPDTDFQIPHNVDGRPPQGEPLGGMLALLGALFDDDVQAVTVNKGLVSFESVLNSPHVYIPHDVVVPGILTAGDLSAVATSLAPRTVKLENLVDGMNRPVSDAQVAKLYGLKK